MVTRRNIVRFLCGVLALAAMHLGSAVAAAATVTWDGGAGTTNWNTATNWSGDVLPTAVDDVVIGPSASVLLQGGANPGIGTLEVLGTLETRQSLQVAGPVTIRSGGRINVRGVPSLRSTAGQSLVESGGTFDTSYGGRFVDLRNEGHVLAVANTMTVDDLFESPGLISGSGSITAGRFVATGITNLYGRINTLDGELAGTHAICELDGSWRVTAGSLTLSRACTSTVDSFSLEAGAALHVSLHANLKDPIAPATQRFAPLTGATVALNGSIEVAGTWGVDASTTVRRGTLVEATGTLTGTPTVIVSPALVDGPGSWTVSAGAEPAFPKLLRFAIVETVPPTAPANLHRTGARSALIEAAWDAATDTESGIQGYSFEVDAAPDTTPDAISDVTARSLYDYAGPGTWYVHVRAIDRSGNAGPTIHAGPWEVIAPGRWHGGGGTTSWHDGSNWDAGVAPEPGADVEIWGLVGPTIITQDVEAGHMASALPVTLSAGRTLRAGRIELDAAGDLLGGTVDTPALVMSGATLATMTSTFAGLELLAVTDVSFTLHGSVSETTSLEGAAQVHVDGDIAGSVSVAEQASLTTNEIAIEPDGSLGIGGSVTADVVEVAGGTQISGSLVANTYHHLPGATAGLVTWTDTTLTVNSIRLDGGDAWLQAPIGGDLTIADVDVTFGTDPLAPGPEVNGDLTMLPGAHVSLPDGTGHRLRISGLASLAGDMAVAVPAPTTSWGQVFPLVNAAGGITGTAAVTVTNAQGPTWDVVVLGPSFGIAERDEWRPDAPTATGTLGAAATDGSRPLTATWSHPGDFSGLAGYAVLVDGAPTTTPVAAITEPPSSAGAIFTLSPGTWYLHVRARDGAGNWGSATHAGPFAVSQPTTTVPVGTTPAVDRCSNIPGVQEALPRRTSARVDGTCWTTASTGADQLWGSFRAEMFRGGRGNDVVRARGGADRLYGDAGSDRLFGEAGDDRILGGAGRDFLYGGAGRDVIDARDRARGDVVSCGAGRDVAYLNRGDRAARDCERVLRS